MINDNDVIDTLAELEAFLLLIDNGGLGLKNVAGVALATNNTSGRQCLMITTSCC
jgi:hypothetical protein